MIFFFSAFLCIPQKNRIYVMCEFRLAALYFVYVFFFAVESQTSLYHFFFFWSKFTVADITFTSSQVAMTTKQSNLFSKNLSNEPFVLKNVR